MTTIIGGKGVSTGERQNRESRLHDFRRVSARANVLSPRLAHARDEQARRAAAGRANDSCTGATTAVVRTDRTGEQRRQGSVAAGWRAERATRVERMARAAERRSRVRRSASRPRACARRREPSVRLCVMVGVGALLVVLALVGLARIAEPIGSAPTVTVGSGGASSTFVTVRAGESLADVARSVAPGRPVGAVTAEIAEINGLVDGHVDAGQTLVTPRY